MKENQNYHVYKLFPNKSVYNSNITYPICWTDTNLLYPPNNFYIALHENEAVLYYLESV